jgi:hypothetical protein
MSVEVLPAPGEIKFVEIKRTNRCHEILSMNSTRLQGNIGVEFNGRMGNNMIQYIHCKAQAVKRRSGLVKIVLSHDSKYGRNLDVFSRVNWLVASGPTLKMGSLCGGEFAQYYLYLAAHREMAKCLFSPTFLGWRPKNGLVLQSTDVVIHFRDVKAESLGTTSILFPRHHSLANSLPKKSVLLIHTTVFDVAFTNSVRKRTTGCCRVLS